ncbi:MAG: hypothetical protein JW809_11420 [Pirellulales bacterium]|nr:hypothetical protein [Pirellulales bacterium]
MSEPAVSITLDDDARVYRPGETLLGEYRIERMDASDVKAVEVSVLWYTEGKGDEDLAVHQFERLSTDDGDWIDTAQPGRFQTTLPRSPLSYDGVLLRIVWCVRVRVFPRRGREFVGERPFVLGAVQPGRVIEP